MKTKVSIISLKEHNHRAERLIADLNESGMTNVSITDAVNGKELTAIEYFNNMKCINSKLRGRKTLTPSELGCFMSHKKAIEEFLSSDNETLIVLEDDVSLLNKSIYKNLTTSTFEIKNSCDVFILGGQDGLKSFNRVVLTGSGIYKSVFKPTIRFVYRTCSYMVNRKTAKEILSIMNETPFFADDWCLLLKKTNIQGLKFARWFSHPLDISNSTIESERKII
ncbi:glycosyltransferase family 25 protein [Vibrio owensii]|uniref:glycosyltransferase family 25 protein n=1 Tax=Vibrio owensii TaxID=696485 RepID=UPI003DA0D5FD